jgi:hypothetical protein
MYVPCRANASQHRRLMTSQTARQRHPYSSTSAKECAKPSAQDINHERHASDRTSCCVSHDRKKTVRLSHLRVRCASRSTLVRASSREEATNAWGPSQGPICQIHPKSRTDQYSSRCSIAKYSPGHISSTITFCLSYDCGSTQTLTSILWSSPGELMTAPCNALSKPKHIQAGIQRRLV